MRNFISKYHYKDETITVLFKIFLPGVILLLLLIFFSFLTRIDFGLLSRDVNGIFDAPPYVGMLSNIGCILWSFTVAVLFFTYVLLIKLGDLKKQSRFILFSGALSLLLLVDDMFLLHEYVMPVYLKFHDSIFYFIYGFSVILIVYFYFRIILQSDFLLFISAFVLFALSAFFSESQDYFNIVIPYQHILEDGTKFLGILIWFIYFTSTSYTFIISLKKSI
jgi:hypothetical protein